MYGAGPDVFAVWGYTIANAVDSQVELNAAYLAPLIGTTVERVQAAIAYLCASDPRSRSKGEEGRRLVPEGEFAYRVPNHDRYRRLRDERDRREYMRTYQQARRARRRVAAQENGAAPLAPKPPNPAKPAPARQAYGEFGHVKLSAAELAKLADKLGVARREELMTALDLDVEANGRRVKSAYATILKWANFRVEKDRKTSFGVVP